MNEQIAQDDLTSPVPLNKYNTQYEQAISNLKSLHADIGAKFVKLGEMKQQFFHIQEKKFVKTFISIMDRLSTELVEATKATETIDKEINSDPHCVYLQKELDYFERHRDSTQQSIKIIKERILHQFRRSKQISQERQTLHAQLYKETAKQHKYASKTRVLNLRRQQLQNNVISDIRPQTATQRQKSSSSQMMGKRNLSSQKKINSSKSRQLSKVQTAMTEKQSSRPYVKSCRLQ